MKRVSPLGPWTFTALLVLGGAIATPASALPLITNGGFEDGFDGWTRVDALGSDGTFLLQSGTASPSNGDPVPAPPAGTKAAMSDAQGPGSHVLYQDFVVPAVVPGAVLSFDLFIGNRAGEFFAPDTLDFATAELNQHARVDILFGGTDPFSVSPADVLLNVFRTEPGDPLVSGYTTLSNDVSALIAAHAGQTLRLRFAEADNVFIFQLGVDQVRLNVVPEPGPLALLGVGLTGLAWRAGKRRRRIARGMGAWVVGVGVATSMVAGVGRADSIPTAMVDPNLEVATVVGASLAQPIGIAFLGSVNDFLVAEKASGQIKRVVNGVVQAIPVLDLPVNSASERGLLSIALHPAFPATPFVYVSWTESTSGADSNVTSEVALLGNRVDRFVWNAATGSLSFDRNLIRLRARQTDNVAVPGHAGIQNGNENGNHNGGVLKFGPDGKLYLFVGEVGRRGWMQNLLNGPFLTTPLVDDTFGGPAPDAAHLSGVILRLNDDGSTPADNPFLAVGAATGGEVGANLQKLYSYGHRNGFGMAFDPYSGLLWATENGDDSFSEINRIVPGMNGGWIQVMGPLIRIAQFKSIETTQFQRALQQVRYPPTRIAYTAKLARARMFLLPGATYVDPQFSWKYDVGPAGTGFVQGTGLGPEYEGTLWIGSARSFQQVGGTGGSLYAFDLTSNRLRIKVNADPRLADRVADNLFRPQKFEGTESETLIAGTGFGATPQIEQGPDGNLYVVSITDGAIYRIRRGP